MSLNPLAQVTDYNTMLNRIFLCSTLCGIVAIAVLRNNWPALENVLAKLDPAVQLGPIEEIKFLGYIIPGAIIAFFMRMFRVHDRISDWFRLRQNYDLYEIIIPLARGSNVPIGEYSMTQLTTHRSQLMGRIFYKYAGSPDPKIDKHLVYMALDWFSFYWAVIEAMFIFSVTTLILLWIGAYSTAAIVGGACAFLLFVAIALRRFCARATKAEVSEILQHEDWKADIKEAFRAIQD